jgi:hypothetical protein
MSTRYITALLSPDRAPSALNAGNRWPERGQQLAELRAAGSAEANGVVRAQPGRQQLEATVEQPGGRRQVDHAVGGEAALSSPPSEMSRTAKTEMPSRGLPSNDQARAVRRA